MKRKTRYIALLALTFIVGAFFMPTAALAGGGDISTDPPQNTSIPTPETAPPTSPWDDPATGNPFTPDGQATVVDNATDEDGKEFFTFTTPEGNVFFLVIDRSRPTNNVYFLNAVTEQDLMALAEVSSPNDSPFAPVPDPLPQPIPDPDELPQEPEIEAEPEAPPTGNGTVIFAIIAALAFGGAAYYLKIVRPKKQGAAFDDEDEEFDEEEDFDDDELVYEDEEEFTVDGILEEYGSGTSTQMDDEEEERLFDETH